MNYLPFPYPGRGPNTLPQFLCLRKDLKELYVYDLLFSSGEMLYSCAGGIGATKEKYVIKMHQFLQLKASRKIIEEVYKKELNGIFSRTRYLRLREGFNEQVNKLGNYVGCAKLYLLWVGSRFTHRYRKGGYDGTYSPTALLPNHIESISHISRKKNLLFRKEDWREFSEHLVNEGIFLYLYLPPTYGVYGPGFTWNEQIATEVVKKINEFVEKNYRVCICTKWQSRGRILAPYSTLLQTFTNKYELPFKGLEWSSDLYLLNF